MFIPVCEPVLDGRELEYAAEAIRTGWISSGGKFLERFESAFAEYVDCKNAVAVANGTAALQVAVRALELPRKSKVVLPTFTIISCARAIIDSDCIPVFVDVDENDWNISTESVLEVIDDDTSAVMIVHMYGHPVDLDPIAEVTEQLDIAIIEDAAQAHGGSYKGRRCGSLGKIAAFSFYANKLITTGEGGMVTTSDDQLAERSRSLRNLCFKPEQRFHHDELGWNFRLTNVQAAIGLAQLERADVHLEKKRQIAQWYTSRLQCLDGLTLPGETQHARSTFWMYAIVLDPAIRVDAGELSGRLAEKGIQTRPFFQPLHAQPPFQQYADAQKVRSFRVAERIARYGLYLPSGIGLEEDSVNWICDCVVDCLPEIST